MQLFLFRFSMKERDQKDAFERSPAGSGAFTREEWLREVFSKEFAFAHRSAEVFFVPVDPSEVGLPAHLIIGWLARDKVVSERTAPWEGLDPTEHKSWQAALFLLDPSHHEDGQKLALEYRADVAQPMSVLASLASYFENRRTPEPFSVAVFPIIQERSFARFADQHVGKITTITYDVAVPNMFDNPNDFSSELRELRDKGNVARVKTELRSDGAINTDASQLNEIATHVENGGGKITAKTKDGDKYNSDDHLKKEDIDIEDAATETPSFWMKIGEALDRIF